VIRAVVFDVGECLVDETREYGTWADWLGVPRHTFSTVFGATIARGLDYRETFQVFAPGFDLAAQREARAAAGRPETFDEGDLYPEVRSSLAQLRDAGLVVGIAGNQTARAGRILRSLTLPADFVATSDDWGVEKPDPAFFDRVVHEVGFPAEEVLYVGDRLDNDIRPAASRGLGTVLIRRGPWAVIQRHDPDAAAIPVARIHLLSDLPDLVVRLNASGR
jgi:HAD superfamily hydrolase (TIGR01549 family)